MPPILPPTPTRGAIARTFSLFDDPAYDDYADSSSSDDYSDFEDERRIPIRAPDDSDLGFGYTRSARDVFGDRELASLLQTIPLDPDAPVGTSRRRLVKKVDLEREEAGYDGEDNEEDDDEEAVDEDVIEADRKKVEEAADRLMCKKVIVKVTRRELVTANEMGEVLADGEIQAEIGRNGNVTQQSSLGDDDKENFYGEKLPASYVSPGSRRTPMKQRNLDDLEEADSLPADIFALASSQKSTKEKGHKRTAADLDLTVDSSDDEDMILRKPGEPRSKKSKLNKANPRSREALKFENIDELETIQAGEIGKVKDARQFRDVTEEKVRWRSLGMRTPLFEHQVLGVDWMVNHEVNCNPRGGLVMDAMGLGKTIQTIAMMAQNVYDADEVDRSVSGVTLIVAPVALLPQWRSEIIKHSRSGFFKVRIHHGQDKIQSVSELKSCDVVLCSYNAVMGSVPSTKPPNGKRFASKEEREEWYEDLYLRNRGIFHRIKFYRVVLDESHMIKNPMSRTSIACQRLEAEYKWCLSGTPIVNNLKDIYPVFSFIRHPTAGTPDGFRKLLDAHSDKIRGQRIQAVLRGCSMRRTKNDRLMGRPLIQLPKKRERLVELDFTPDERALYDFIFTESKNTINKALRRGELHSGDYSKILVLLLRLRQCCSHPWLILNSISAQFSDPQIETLLSEVREGGPIYRAITAGAEARADQPFGACNSCEAYTPLFQTSCKHRSYCVDCISEIEECPQCHRDLLRTNLDAQLPPLPPFIYSSKTRALADQLLVWRQEYPGQKVIIYSLFIQLLDLVQEMLQTDPAFSETITFARYQGNMGLEEREDALHQFRTDENCAILLTSMKAGGIGLNLTDASLVVSLDLWWNRATEDQAFARVHRLGQTKEVEVIRLVVKNTVEQRILKLQKVKMKIAGTALGEGDMKLGKLSFDDLLGLFGRVHRGEDGRMQLM